MTEYLGNVRNLTINPFARDDIRSRAAIPRRMFCVRIHGEGDSAVGKGELRVLELGYLGAYCAIDEFGELRNLKVDDLIQVSYHDLVQVRAIDPANKVLQILASAFEPKGSESGKDSPCKGRTVFLIGREVAKSNPMTKVSSLGNAAKDVNIASGEM